MRDSKYLILALIVVIIILGYELFKPDSKPDPIITTDTVYFKPDTVIITKKHYITISGKIDTLKDTLFMDYPIITATADTLIDSSRIKIKYFLPPLNKFDIMAEIKERIITKIKEITITKEVVLWEPFYKDYWFYSTLGSILLLILLL